MIDVHSRRLIDAASPRLLFELGYVVIHSRVIGSIYLVAQALFGQIPALFGLIHAYPVNAHTHYM